jgi:hypothetical protein
MKDVIKEPRAVQTSAVNMEEARDVQLKDVIVEPWAVQTSAFTMEEERDVNMQII